MIRIEGIGEKGERDKEGAEVTKVENPANAIPQMPGTGKYTDTEVVWEISNHFYVGIYTNDSCSTFFKFPKPLSFVYRIPLILSYRCLPATIVYGFAPIVKVE